MSIYYKPTLAIRDVSSVGAEYIEELRDQYQKRIHVLESLAALGLGIDKEPLDDFMNFGTLKLNEAQLYVLTQGRVITTGEPYCPVPIQNEILPWTEEDSDHESH